MYERYKNGNSLSYLCGGGKEYVLVFYELKIDENTKRYRNIRNYKCKTQSFDKFEPNF